MSLTLPPRLLDTTDPLWYGWWIDFKASIERAAKVEKETRGYNYVLMDVPDSTTITTVTCTMTVTAPAYGVVFLRYFFSGVQNRNDQTTPYVWYTANLKRDGVSLRYYSGTQSLEAFEADAGLTPGVAYLYTLELGTDVGGSAKTIMGMSAKT